MLNNIDYFISYYKERIYEIKYPMNAFQYKLTLCGVIKTKMTLRENLY